jgi:hypothetical protein
MAEGREQQLQGRGAAGAGGAGGAGGREEWPRQRPATGGCEKQRWEGGKQLGQIATTGGCDGKMPLYAMADSREAYRCRAPTLDGRDGWLWEPTMTGSCGRWPSSTAVRDSREGQPWQIAVTGGRDAQMSDVTDRRDRRPGLADATVYCVPVVRVGLAGQPSDGRGCQL